MLVYGLRYHCLLIKLGGQEDQNNEHSCHVFTDSQRERNKWMGFVETRKTKLHTFELCGNQTQGTHRRGHFNEEGPR